MIYLVDTNVLLRLIDHKKPQHASARDALDTLRCRGDDLFVTNQNLAEFWNVCTRPVKDNGLELTIQQAEPELALIEKLFPLYPEPPGAYPIWRSLLISHNVRGVQVHDARLVATMLFHRVTHILTFDVSDFKRYDNLGIVAVNPETI